MFRNFFSSGLLKGNKNELIVCIGKNKENIDWVNTFSWSTSEDLTLNIRNYVYDQKILNDSTYTNIYNYLVRRYTSVANIAVLGDSGHTTYNASCLNPLWLISGIYTISNYSVSGETIAQQKARWAAGANGNEDVTFIFAGINDIIG